MLSCSRIMREQVYCKAHLRPHKGGTGILKIGKALGIGTGAVQRVIVIMEQSRHFDVDVAEAALASQ
jgi:hypothetical protein